MPNGSFFTPVQESISLVEALMRGQINGHHPDLIAALDHLLSSGGKRIRPTVTLLTGKMLGAQQEAVITLAAAIELLHTASLVHDDLIDGSLLRRGMPTLNSQWTPAATVLTGDFIFARAAKLAAETGSVEVMRLFSETLITIVNGEITQMFGGPEMAERANYYSRIYSKTASMFELATLACAILSGQKQPMAESARKFGYEIGMAFQIVDDVLDFTGEQATIGKPVASDLHQGLVTLPAINYLEAHPDDADMRQVVNGNYFDEQRISRLVIAIRESGAIEKALDEASQFVDRGLAALAAFPVSGERQALEDMARYIVRRRL